MMSKLYDCVHVCVWSNAGLLLVCDVGVHDCTTARTVAAII